MIRPFILTMLLFLFLGYFSVYSIAQTANNTIGFNDNEKINKPYRILTAGKQVTIKSTKNIKSIMVWSSGGNRIIEDKNVNAANYNFRITVNEKIFFIRVQLADGKTYSEKIGIQ
ncbi:MAG: hypothetical protein ACXWWC_15855 [Chitinophagaceae bacterium]